MTPFFRALLISGLAVTGIAGAAAAKDPSESEAVTAAIDCLDIADDAERLKCLDGAARTLAVTRVIREEKQAKSEENQREGFGFAKKYAEGEEEQPQDFGANALISAEKGEDGKLKSISAKIVEIRVNVLKVATITLENGQVWRQLESDDRSIKPGKKDRLYTAKVKRGAFGNYMLTVNELHTTIRVTRIK